MNQQPELDRLVTHWLEAAAPSRAPERVLAMALGRVAEVGQERSFGSRRFDAWIGRSPRRHWAIVGALLAAALIGIVAGAGALLRDARPAPPHGGSSGWVAFTVEGNTRQAKSDIYLVRNGAAARRIIGSSTSGVRNVCPSFSPDGTMLAYSEAQPGAIGTDLGGIAVVITALDRTGLPTGPIVRLPVSTVIDACPKWAPNGQSVAFVAQPATSGGQPELWIGHLDGSSTRVPGWAATGRSFQFDWSPDGTAIVAAGASTVWIVPLDGRQARPLPNARAGVQFENPKWSPDGTRVVVMAETFVMDSSGAGSITRMGIEVDQADGSGAPVDLGLGTNPAWSPDGQRVAFLRTATEAGVPQSQIVTASPATGDRRVIATEPRFIRGFAWSPDGLRLVYVADRDSTSGGLVSVSADGDSAPIVLTEQPYSFEYSGALSWQRVSP